MASNSAYTSPTSKEPKTEDSFNTLVEDDPSQGKQYLTGVKLGVLLGSLTLVTFLLLLDTSIIGTAIPHITTEFHALPDVGCATLQPMSGKFYTHFSTKIVYLSFVFTFEIGSLVCGVASSSMIFIVGRAIAGLGASGLTNDALTIISGAVPLEKSPMYTGFSMSLVLGLLPELDLLGFALFVPSAVMLLLALQFGSGNTYPWNSATIIGLFCGAGGSTVIFILWERKMGDKAMIPGAILRQPVVWSSCIFGSCIMCCTLVASNWIPTYFQAVKGEGPTMSGVYILPSILSSLLFVVASGVAVTHLGYYLPWALFSGVVTAIGNGLISTFTASTSTGPLIAAQNAVRPSQVPIVLAILIFFQNLGTAIAVVISSTIFAQTLASTVPRYAPSVSPKAALDAGSGASAVRNLVVGHEEELKGILRCYSESVRNVFYFLVGLAGLAAVVSVGMGWKDVRVTTEGNKAEIAATEE
ncbi:MFS general substrate transporter [Cucurbitaria berberidis CBS 394.84]|uniref:MFS general substrate transporter n=1 Tax=Cucurbitaria berberidis CBS 394.84 TaxID=1168544 RepID=A0A9P4L9W7_9PLEO|nr:MFS general substrate transporter [Cucurbitaria berberidis CBS 394.84]KAF1846818.1 MFS general substrate transporter [Cucurbitaria berberidis CBS 394.84]